MATAPASTTRIAPGTVTEPARVITSRFFRILMIGGLGLATAAFLYWVFFSPGESTSASTSASATTAASVEGRCDGAAREVKLTRTPQRINSGAYCNLSWDFEDAILVTRGPTRDSAERDVFNTPGEKKFRFNPTHWACAAKDECTVIAYFK